MTSRRLQAAVDVGGTFIDVVVAEKASGSTRIAKVLHRPGTQGQDILAAITAMTRQFGGEMGDVETLVIGTTVVTNALLEHAFARTALITTEGFRDVVEIARMSRASSFDLTRRRPVPIAPRHLRLEIRERMGADGAPLIELDESSLTRDVETLRGEGVESIAVSLLFSFANPDHERRVRDVLSRHLTVPISLSSDVLATFREYERTSTTVINASTVPVMNAFLETLATLASDTGPKLYIMGSDGGCLTLGETRRLPARCTMSGPAGGVLGSLQLAARHDLGDVLTLDVGGTSTDVALLRGGDVPLTSERTIGGYPIALPSVEVETVGAGGGSIAYLDRTGLLKVGPQSAGGHPGPVCYGRGGVRPTVTDAHVALGRLGARTMLGGDFEVDVAAARAAIASTIAGPAGLTPVRAALGIIDVATANIIRAVRSISIERGRDPRDMTLVAFGGAGALHAADVAKALEIPLVAIPLHPGVWSAIGIQSADIRYSAQRTWMRAFSPASLPDLEHQFNELEATLLERARSEGMSTGSLVIERVVDIRYVGQSHSLPIPFSPFGPEGVAAASSRFHEEHLLRYGHNAPAAPLEVSNIQLAVRQPRDQPKGGGAAAAGAPVRPSAHREVWFSEQPVSCPVYDRATLGPGARIEGPAIVEQYDTTTVVPAGSRYSIVPDGGAALIEFA